MLKGSVVNLRILFVIGVCGVLVGCSTPREKAAEELCTGTKRPYQINGVWYQPQDHYEYEEKGVASWYGPGFHKRPKSCGHMFDMHELSAAHKTLPIPCVVQVTNLDTGKKLDLVVDDRGPFVKGRIIDVSKKAAQELGMHNRGLSRIHVVVKQAESKALANYLKRFGRYGRSPDGRTWSEIYYQEIAGKSHHHLSKEPKTVEKMNEFDFILAEIESGT
jgi:rare lipoprotein A